MVDPQKVEKRRRRWWRWVLFLIVIAATAAVVAPWSPPGVRGRIERALSQRLGCRVRIERVRVWLLQGRIDLRQIRLDYRAKAPRLRFAGLPQAVWQLRQATLLFSPGEAIRFRKPVNLQLTLCDPDPVLVWLGEETSDFFPPFHDAPAQPRQSRWQVRSFALDGAAVHVLRAGPDDQATTLITISGIHLRYNADSAAAERDVLLTAYLGSSGESSFHLRATQRDDLWTVRLQTTPLHFHWPSEKAYVLPVLVDFVDARGQARRRPAGLWDFQVTAGCPRMEALRVVETATSLSLRGSFDGSTSQAAVAVELESRDSRLRAAANIVLGGTRDSYTTVSIERLADGWLALFNDRRTARCPRIEGRQARAVLTAAARLLLRKPWIENPSGTVRVRDLCLSSDFLPLTVEDIDLECELRPDRIDLRHCRGHWPRGWLTLSGSHSGPWWPRPVGTATVNWAFGLRIEDLLSTLTAVADDVMTASARAALARAPLLEGAVAGTGTLALGWDAQGRLTQPTTKTLQGAVTLSEGRITHPNLPAPVTDLNGSFEVAPERLQIDSIRGQFLDTTATVSASVSGEPFFWTRPTASCQIQTHIGIAELVRHAPPAIRDALEKADPRGSLSTSVTLVVPLRRPLRREDIQATGTAVLHDGAFRSPFWMLDGQFRDLRGTLELTRGVIRLTTATGRLEDVPFGLRAEADPDGDRFWARLDSAAPMTAVQKIAPRALIRWEVGGHASGWFEFKAWGPDLFRQVAGLRDLTSETIANLPFQWDLEGEVMMRDAQMTFETFPTSLTAINGLTRVKNFDWTFVDLTSSWGKTDNVRIRGGGRIRPGSWPSMRLEMEAPVLYLDEWIRPWRRARGSRFPSRVPNPVFEMTGTLRGKKAFYRGHPGENFYGEHDLTVHQRGVDVYRFYNTRVDLYGGHVLGEGRIDFQRGKSTCTLELAADSISLPPFLQCESGREQTFEGRLSGKGNFRWRDGDPETLTGEGSVLIADSKFWGNVFFRNLGRLIKIPILDDVSFATIAAPYRLRGRHVECANLDMEGPLIAMRGSGAVGFDHTVDFVLELGFRRLPQYAWLLDLIVQNFGRVPATVFLLDLKGTWDDPQYSFHHLGVAERGLLSALEQIWGAVAPGPSKEREVPSPNRPF